jgi:TRAP-type C4-dicarboxylate transport system substrate-binding protein
MHSAITPVPRRTFLLGAAAAALAARTGKAAPKVHLRLATLAPAQSSWMNTFQAIAREVRERTGGAVELKLYGGGVMGDEAAMVRKLRTGQLDGAAVTSVGLGAIDPRLLVLQLPMVFRGYDELDRARARMAPTFAKALGDAGFVLAGWGDVGPGYIFSNRAIATPADVRAAKMWVWDADPVAQATMAAMGARAVKLTVPDVLPSLQTGVVDAFTNSPYGAIALQWHTRVKFVTNLKLSMIVGGTVISKEAWEKLAPAHRQLIHEIGEREHVTLLKKIRDDNDAAIRTLQAKGIQVVAPQDLPAWKKAADQAREGLQGKLFDKALVDEMLAAAR